MQVNGSPTTVIADPHTQFHCHQEVSGIAQPDQDGPLPSEPTAMGR